MSSQPGKRSLKQQFAGHLNRIHRRKQKDNTQSGQPEETSQPQHPGPTSQLEPPQSAQPKTVYLLHQPDIRNPEVIPRRLARALRSRVQAFALAKQAWKDNSFDSFGWAFSHEDSRDEDNR